MSDVKIGNVIYKIRRVKKLHRHKRDGVHYYYGFVDHRKCKILVNRMNPQTERVSTLHEILHVIFHQAGIFCDQEETIVIALSHGILQILIDNPELVKLLLTE